jgi:hypothetical protein
MISLLPIEFIIESWEERPLWSLLSPVRTREGKVGSTGSKRPETLQSAAAQPAASSSTTLAVGNTTN